MERPNLDRMTAEQRLGYLKDTDHLVVKWVNCMDAPHSHKRKYHRDYMPHLTDKLCDATFYHTRHFSLKVPGYTLIPVTKKELFEARLKGK